MSYSSESTVQRVDRTIQALRTVAVEAYRDSVDVRTIALDRAHSIDGAHVYFDLLNARQLLNSPDESEHVHRRFLRVIHIFARVASVVLQRTGCVKVDLQNTRLHYVVANLSLGPAERVALAVATAALLRHVITSANALHNEVADIQVRVGVDCGPALVVTNGTRGDREPLFLGEPANQAGKLASGTTPGIFLCERARTAVRLPGRPDTALTDAELRQIAASARMTVSKDQIDNAWKESLSATPLQTFSFYRPTPPLKSLDFAQLSPGHSARIESVAIFADISNFTKFIAGAMGTNGQQGAVRALHVIRKELRDVLTDHDGRKVRYIGDCVVGVLASTDRQKTVDQAVLCGAALQEAIKVTLERLALRNVTANTGLGLAVGFELGTNVITRLGVRGERDRAFVGRAVLQAQACQDAATTGEIAIGPNALAGASRKVAALFPGTKRSGLTYAEVLAATR